MNENTERLASGIHVPKADEPLKVLIGHDVNGKIVIQFMQGDKPVNINVLQFEHAQAQAIAIELIKATGKEPSRILMPGAPPPNVR